MKLWKTAEFLQGGIDLVTGDRAEQNGPLLENHQNIAALWSAFKGVEFSPADVATMMALLKIARTKSGEFNDDDYRDGAAYTAIAGELSELNGGE